jgi:ABC-type cobalt transport system substrate-binding protein
MGFLTFSSIYPDGRDVWFHILVARAWSKGTNGMVAPVVMEINNLPYPPLFHFLLLPFVGTVESSLLAAQAMQLIFYPLGTLLLMLLVRKYCGSRFSLLFGLALVGTYFTFNQLQARPQSLEVLFYPVSVWALLENRTKTFILSVAIMFYTHSPISIGLTLGLVVYAFMQNRKDMKVWASVLAVAPIVLYQAGFMFNRVFFNRWLAVGDTGVLVETQAFVSNPLFWLMNGLGLNMIAFAAVPWLLYKWKLQSRFTHVMLYSFFGMLVLLPTWYQRILTFAMMPFAFFTVLSIKNIKNRNVRILLVAALVIQAILFALTPVWWMSPPDYFSKYW